MSNLIYRGNEIELCEGVYSVSIKGYVRYESEALTEIQLFIDQCTDGYETTIKRGRIRLNNRVIRQTLQQIYIPEGAEEQVFELFNELKQLLTKEV